MKRGNITPLFLESRHYMGGGWWTPRPANLPPERDPAPNVQEPGWAPELVWKGTENLAPTRI
jgi:hypothetical protein